MDSAARLRHSLSMNDRKPILTAVCMAFVLAGNASAFDAFGSTGPGTHIGSAQEALAGVYNVTIAEPEVIKTKPVYGLSTYRWPAFTPAELFCEATRDIDIFYFGPLYPHAQTPDIKYGRDLSAAELEQIELSALWDYLRHMASWLDRVRLLYRDGKPREATYLLGVVTHSYQDLWAHRGITNGMHRALLAHRGIDVDRDADRVAVLRERLPVWLGKLPDLLGDQGQTFVGYLKSGTTVQELALAERKRLLGRGRDLWVQGIVYTLFTTKAERTLRYLEQIEWDIDTLDGILGDPAALASIVSMKDRTELGAFLSGRGYRF
jgi:hypothetical protein